jgi:hypothetical protein
VTRLTGLLRCDMMQYETYEHKSSLASSKDELEQFYEQTAKVTTATGVTLAGKVTSISDRFLTLRFRDGREGKVKRGQIAVISQLPAYVEAV